jgi:hypothetical protein
MSYHDENPQGPGAPGLAADEARIRQAAPSTANIDRDRDLAELQRSLLLYGTAGQAARVRLEGRAS